MPGTYLHRLSNRRRLLTLLVVVLVLFVVGAELLVELRSFERHRGFVETELTSALGLPVEIRGDFHLEVIPRLRFEASDLVVANLPDRASPHLAEIAMVHFELSAWRLLLGNVDIDEIAIAEE